MDKVIVGIASIPSREAALYNVVKSLLPQCDLMHVYLNGYGQVPEWLNNDKIEVYQSQHTGDIGDNGKFFKLKGVKGYCFTCDDDLLYPENYVEYLIAAIEKYNRKAIVGLHGSNFTKPIGTYYHSRHTVHYLNALNEDKYVQVFGTCAMAYHSDTIEFDHTTFVHKNMTDVWVAMQAQEKKVPMICISRPVKFVNDAGKAYYKGSIHQTENNRDAVQTALVKSIDWKLNKL